MEEQDRERRARKAGKRAWTESKIGRKVNTKRSVFYTVSQKMHQL